MRRLRVGLIWMLGLCSFTLTAVGSEARRLKVLTSFLPVYCFTVNVAGDNADVENLLAFNIEPHDYQLSRRDLQKLTEADLLIVNGLGLEQWLQKAFEVSLKSHPKRLVEVSAGLERELIYSSRNVRSSKNNTGFPEPGHSGYPNPHIWLDPRLVMHAVTNIVRALSQQDPLHADGYAANGAAYIRKLEKLDADLAKELRVAEGAAIVTYHDGFAYFARRYRIKVTGVIEPVPEVVPSLKYLAGLYQAMRVDRVQAVFTEAQSAPRLARQVGSDLNLPVASLNTLEVGPLQASAYEDEMRSNGMVLLKFLKPHAQALF